MSFHRIVLFALVTVLAAPSSAFAQDDDLLAPLTPQTKPSRSKSGKTKVVKKKPTREKAPKVTKKPAKTPKSKTARGKAGKKPVTPVEDDLLAPLAPEKTELMVRITGGVRGAKLQVDGKDAGVLGGAPMALEVTPGEHLLVVRKPGYAEYSRRIDAKEGSQTEVSVALDATMGFATLTADVPEATVAVDGEELGPVPQANVLLKPGSREIEFRAPGFKPDVHNITVFAGRPYVVEGQLRPLLDTSTVASSDVPKNTVLDPATRPETSPGVSFDQPAPSDDVEVSSGKPWYGRWYVWAGVGAVVAAGTVGAVMATRGPAPLTEPDVCGASGCDVFMGGVRPVRGGQDKSGGALRVPAGAFRF